jgi:hypothetical protein
MTRPHPIFLVVWAFWTLGCPIYTYGLATGQEWATPIGGFTWLAMFGWFEAFPLIMRQPAWTLSGVIGWLIQLLSGGKDRSWYWLAEVFALPISVLLLVTFAALFGGWIGWTMGLGWGVLVFALLRKHWRYMGGER